MPCCAARSASCCRRSAATDLARRSGELRTAAPEVQSGSVVGGECAIDPPSTVASPNGQPQSRPWQDSASWLHRIAAFAAAPFASGAGRAVGAACPTVDGVVVAANPSSVAFVRPSSRLSWNSATAVNARISTASPSLRGRPASRTPLSGQPTTACRSQDQLVSGRLAPLGRRIRLREKHRREPCHAQHPAELREGEERDQGDHHHQHTRGYLIHAELRDLTQAAD